MILYHNIRDPIYLVTTGGEYGSGTGGVTRELKHWLEETHVRVIAISIDEIVAVPKQSYMMLGTVNPNMKLKLLSMINANDYFWPSFVHPGAVMSGNNRVGKGCIFEPFSYMANLSECGDFCHFAEYASLGHEAVIGNNVFLAPKSKIGGASKVGNNCYVGQYVSVKDRITITDNCYFAMNSIVKKNVTTPGKYYTFNPQIKLYETV